MLKLVCSVLAFFWCLSITVPAMAKDLLPAGRYTLVTAFEKGKDDEVCGDLYLGAGLLTKDSETKYTLQLDKELWFFSRLSVVFTLDPGSAIPSCQVIAYEGSTERVCAVGSASQNGPELNGVLSFLGGDGNIQRKARFLLRRAE